MKILTAPDKKLNVVSGPVDQFDKKLATTLAEMEKTLDSTFDPKGVGLSAPQVGIRKRFFIMRPTEEDKLSVFINPEVVVSRNIKKKGERKLLEGCLSIPDIWGHVTRPNHIKVKFRDSKGRAQSEVFEGFIAAVVQHEIDHLDGILFTQRVMEQEEQLYRSHKNSQGEDEFEPIDIA